MKKTDLSQQGGVCAVKGCGNYGRLLIDHNHETGEVRGLLCYSCNTALGLSRDDPVRLRALALYVETAECDTLPHTCGNTR
jgi:hypothetical protein